MPPVTPRRTVRPAKRPAPVSLALGDLLEGDRERLVPKTGLDERRHELAAPLAQLAVVRVDLAGPLRAQDHQGVLGIGRREQVVDLGFDHAQGVLPEGTGSRGAGGLDDSSDLAGGPPDLVVHDTMVEPRRLRELPFGLREAFFDVALALGAPTSETPLELLDRR